MLDIEKSTVTKISHIFMFRHLCINVPVVKEIRVSKEPKLQVKERNYTYQNEQVTKYG